MFCLLDRWSRGTRSSTHEGRTLLEFGLFLRKRLSPQFASLVYKTSKVGWFFLPQTRTESTDGKGQHRACRGRVSPDPHLTPSGVFLVGIIPYTTALASDEETNERPGYRKRTEQSANTNLTAHESWHTYVRRGTNKTQLSLWPSTILQAEPIAQNMVVPVFSSTNQSVHLIAAKFDQGNDQRWGLVCVVRFLSLIICYIHEGNLTITNWLFA